ncbi:MAG: alpha-amylase family glycosyl hydrolase [Hyphomicrobiaceae bacterium]|nr:alpha-amylase family glycosyl hydrolase [Hyphomicrobiaceae bacterium]
MENVAWWKGAVIYQVYPRSFCDSDGDGVGDLAGLREKLPYLKNLGIDAIWLSPIFRSPMVDFGYDISDYREIDPLFGTMEQFKELLDACHRSGLRMILDLVPNHTSSEHPWFVDSRSSLQSVYRDWYIWREPGPDGGPPNNWLSVFGGSGWELDEASGQYYYHTFLSCQPDLNWRNPDVSAAIQDVLHFWFAMGVDGFRMDALWYILKDEQFRDNPPNPEYKAGQPPDYQFMPLYTADHEEVHDLIAAMRRTADAYQDRLLIGEIYLPPVRLVRYYGLDLEGVHLPFNFALLECAWHARTIATLIEEYENILPEGSWPNWVLGNHDRPRIASKVGDDQARVAAMLLLTLRGTPTIYNGDELGMPLAEIRPDQVQDPLELNVPGLGLGRDAVRSPMPWDSTAQAGFSEREPWCPLIGDWQIRNVAALDQEPGSILNLYRRLLNLRRRYHSLALGSYHPVAARGDALVYIRKSAQSDSVLIALNLGSEAQKVIAEGMSGEILLSTVDAEMHGPVADKFELRPNEGLMIAVSTGAKLKAASVSSQLSKT